MFIVLFALSLSLWTVYEHVSALGFTYLEEGNQTLRHQAVLDGHAGNPWQYRIFADYLVEGTIRLSEWLGVPHYRGISFIMFRILQGVLIFMTSYFYYRKLGLSTPHALIGMSLLAWGMSYANYDSDLQFNTYFDVLFYLLAGLCIIRKKPVYLIPVTLLAALNRETSGLIPFVFMFTCLVTKTSCSRSMTRSVFVTALLLYGATFVALRISYGTQQFFYPYGHHPGLDLLKYNLLREVTWIRLFATLGIVPILAFLGLKHSPLPLRVFFWVVAPAWFLIHTFGAVMAETRLFLVPQALVFIPGALFLAQRPSARRDAVPERKGPSRNDGRVHLRV